MRAALIISLTFASCALPAHSQSAGKSESLQAIQGNDTQGEGGEAFNAPTYACRPPGVYHGPFKSNQGCLLYEFHYYEGSKK